jgi:transcriptional regulator with XRE-family HTH domain
MSNEASTNHTADRQEGPELAPTPPNVDEHIGSRIRARRRMLRLTQDELATRIGVTAQQIHKYENGSNRVAASKLFEIATILTLPISAFFEGLVSPHADGAGVAAEARAKDRLLLDKEILELAMSFDDIEEARLRRVVLRIIKAAAEAQKDQD